MGIRDARIIRTSRSRGQPPGTEARVRGVNVLGYTPRRGTSRGVTPLSQTRIREDSTMADLHYATVTSERHSVVVSTWTEVDGSTWVKMTVDGRTLTMRPIELAAGTDAPAWDWLDCCDMPGPLHADDCAHRLTAAG